MDKNMTINWKKSNAFTTIDIAVSVVIIMIFIAMITTLFYNFYLSTTSKNRNAIATNCVIDTIEQVKMMDYDKVSTSSVTLLIETLVSNAVIPQGYTVNAEVQKYNETEGNTDKEDLIKILKVNVEYTVGQKTETIEISTLLTK